MIILIYVKAILMSLMYKNLYLQNKNRPALISFQRYRQSSCDVANRCSSNKHQKEGNELSSKHSGSRNLPKREHRLIY